MARTANSARKQVLKKPAAKQNTSKEAVDKAADKLVEKVAVEKLVSKVLDSKKIIEQKQAPASQSSKRPARVATGKTLSVSTPKISQKPEVQKPRKASANVLREIKYYQNNIGFLIPRAAIVRMVRSILLETVTKAKIPLDSNFKFTVQSLDIIHETLENYLVYLIELAYMAARHAKRVTLFASDIRLISRIKNI